MSQQCYGFIVDDVGSKHLGGLARVVSAYPKIFLHIPPIFKMWYVMGR